MKEPLAVFQVMMGDRDPNTPRVWEAIEEIIETEGIDGNEKERCIISNISAYSFSGKNRTLAPHVIVFVQGSRVDEIQRLIGMIKSVCPIDLPFIISPSMCSKLAVE